jgi:hypothetical protein
MPRHTMAEDRDRARLARAERRGRRVDQMRERMAAAKTPESQLATAFDWFRAAARRLAGQDQTRAGVTPNKPEADRLTREAASFLARLAGEMDGGTHDRAR